MHVNSKILHHEYSAYKQAVLATILFQVIIYIHLPHFIIHNLHY